MTRWPIERAQRFVHCVWLGLLIAACLSLPSHAQGVKNTPNAPDPKQEVPPEDPEPDPDLGMDPFFEVDADFWTEAAYSMIGGSRAEVEQATRRQVRNTLNLIERLAGLSPELREKVSATAEHELRRLDADIAAIVSQASKHPNEDDYKATERKFLKISEPFQRMLGGGARDKKLQPQALWEKVLFSNLTEKQNEEFQKDQREKERYCDKIDRLETLLKVSRVLGLSSQQLKDFEAIADANPEAWTTLVTAWTTLSAMPVERQREHFTEAQRIRLTLPLEYVESPGMDPFK